MPVLDLASTKFFSNTLYTISIFSIPIHTVGALCILFSTPKAMKSVKWSMFNLHFWAVSLDILLSILVQPFICTPVYAGIPLGISKTLGVETWVMVYCVFTVYILVNVSVVAIFENRFFILFAHFTWWRHCRHLLLGLDYLLSVTFIIPALLLAPDQGYARKEMFKIIPKIFEYETPEYPIYVLTLEDSWFLPQQQAMCVVVGVQALIFIVLLRINMNRAFRTMEHSERTLNLQKAFLRALNLQIFIPLLIIIFPSFCLGNLGASKIHNQAVNNLVFLITSTHGAVSTLMMLYLHKPYREACQKFTNRFTDFNASAVPIT